MNHTLQTVLFLSTFLTSLYASAQQHSEPILDIYENNYFYNLSQQYNDKLIVFLHGGVNNPYFQQPSDQIALNYIIENNTIFLNHASEHGFDLIIPIAHTSLNWLSHPNEAFSVLKDYIESIPKRYREVYISGFSDGGTGGFKIFYGHPDYFNGLIVFNGYPQHSNFYQNIDHSSVRNQKVIFFSTLQDKTIPYEFLLTEYCAQKKENADTYFYLASGNHSFESYGEQDLRELFIILSNKVRNNKTDPIHGFIKNDQLITLYPFRKQIVRKYNFGRDIYKDNIQQLKKYRK